jgi:hypothetical protein
MMPVLYGYNLYPDITITCTLSLAVFLVDDYTDRQPVGLVNVLSNANGRDLKSIKNRSHYYLFFNVPGDVVHIRVESDYYFDVNREITISQLDPKQPVEVIELQPGPGYPFPAGTTLIRGMVRDSQENWLAGANVSTTVPAFDTSTTLKGEFVCYYTGLKDEDIVVIDGKRYLKGGEDNIISLLVTYDTLSGGVELTGAAEGEVTVLASPVILNKT